MKVDSYIKEFLQDEKIKELINENKIEEVFDVFYDLIFYKDIDRRINSQIDGTGTIIDANFLNYNQNKDDLTNFNNATWEVKFDNGRDAVILGKYIEII